MDRNSGHSFKQQFKSNLIITNNCSKADQLNISVKIVVQCSKNVCLNSYKNDKVFRVAIDHLHCAYGNITTFPTQRKTPNGEFLRSLLDVGRRSILWNTHIISLGCRFVNLVIRPFLYIDVNDNIYFKTRKELYRPTTNN